MQPPSSPEYLAKPLHPVEHRAGMLSLLIGFCSGWSLAIAALFAYWLLFFNQIRGEWQVNPQYSYGYVVPLLGLILFWRRWPGRPEPIPGNAHVAGLIAGALLLLALPLRVLFEANPEWRLLYWISGLDVLGVTLCLLGWLGGTRWVRYFAPPLLFMLIALPWPMNLEQGAIQNLMRLVAGMTVTVVNCLGIPAVQHGNLIEVSAGLVGIDEACSGVRSLQSSLMLSLFLGEMNRWSWKRRAGLLGASMLFVLLANLVRTTFLVWAAARRGIPQMQAWHDAAGILIMLIVLPGLLSLSYWMRPKEKTGEAAASTRFSFPSLPRWVGVTMLLWLATTEITTELWYRSHEKNLVANIDWSVAWPDAASRFKKTELPENSRVILRCNHTESATWQDDLGNDWSAFVLNWDPGKNSAQLAKGHRPDICFPAAGAKLAGDFGRVPVTADGFEIPFHYQSFESRDRLLHVFYCLWPDKIAPANAGSSDDASRTGRIRAALNGERNLGQKVLEIVICGPETRDEAISLLRSQAAVLIRKS
jgi:exosortase